MDDLTRDSLKKMVDAAVLKVIQYPNSGSFRCHEMIRGVRNEISDESGFLINVCDGIATYQADYLNQLFKDRDHLYSSAEFRDFLTANRTKPFAVPHSWGEVDEFIIDCHQNIDVNGCSSISQIRLVHSKDEIKGKVDYDARGSEFSLFGMKFFYVPPLYVTRIKI